MKAASFPTISFFTADVGLSFREVGLFSGGTDIAVGAFVLFLTNLSFDGRSCRAGVGVRRP
jgi:hypothetical protein